MTADPFDFGVKFHEMTPVQRRVHNRRAGARNAGLPVESTDTLCALELDFPDWTITPYDKGTPAARGEAAIPPGALVAERTRLSILHGGGRLTAGGIDDLRVQLEGAEDQIQRAGAQWW
jgi:hypothetical protein